MTCDVMRKSQSAAEVHVFNGSDGWVFTLRAEPTDSERFRAGRRMQSQGSLCFHAMYGAFELVFMFYVTFLL